MFGGPPWLVVQTVVAYEARRQPRRVVGIGDIARRTRHAGAMATLVVHGAIVVRLAHPSGVTATGADHHRLGRHSCSRTMRRRRWSSPILNSATAVASADFSSGA